MDKNRIILNTPQENEEQKTARMKAMMESFFSNVGSDCRREEEGDYRDENGILYCGKCHTPKEKEHEIPYLGLRRHFCMCACQLQEVEKREEQERIRKEQEVVDQLFRYSLVDDRFRASTFENYVVNEENRKAYTIARNYVAKYEEMYKRNKGLILWGTPGTGKTFLASCIANELLRKRIPILVTSILKLTSPTGPFSREMDEQQTFVSKMNQARILFIDDLGTERTTDYKMEQVFEVIDSRYGAKKPMIITTNLHLRSLKEETDMRKRRIYERILEVCFPVHCVGTSWRTQLARSDYDEINALLTEDVV